MEDFVKAAGSGVAGAVVMNLFLYLYGTLTRNEMKLIGILGRMITFEARRKSKSPLTRTGHASRIAGTMAYYLTGMLLSVLFFLLWSNDIGRPDYMYAVIFGCVTGTMAVLILKLLFAIHPGPPSISINAYISTLLLANIVYSLTVVFVYHQLNY